LPTDQAILTDLADRPLRERVHTASTGRGNTDDAQTDTRGLILDLARARAQRAQLLGYENHSSYVAAGSTATTTEAINEVLTRLALPARRNAETEERGLCAAFAQEHPGTDIEPWDWQYYAEVLRRA